MKKIALIAVFNFITLAIFLSLYNCNRKNKLDINISSIKLDISIEHFEKDLFSIHTNNLENSLKNLKKKYSNFYDIYFNNIIGDKSKDYLHKNAALKIIKDQNFISLNNDVLKAYPDDNALKKELVDAFKRYKYYFPEKKIPNIITFISGFNNAIVNIDNTLAIGLDMFLGKDYKPYFYSGMPKYIINRLSKEYMPPMAMQGFAKQEFNINDEDKTFLNQMIYEGKILYFIDAMLPYTSTEIKLGYSKAQLNWAEYNEPEIWTNFIDEGMLYTSDQRKYNKYLEEAPFSSGFYNDSAPRLAFFTGLKIVQSYMEHNPDISLKQLMEEKNPIKILNKAKYKPKHKR